MVLKADEELTIEQLAKCVDVLSRAVLSLSSVYWDSKARKYGHQPHRAFTPEQVDGAWAGVSEAMDTMTSEGSCLGYDVLHRCLAISQGRPDPLMGYRSTVRTTP